MSRRIDIGGAAWQVASAESGEGGGVRAVREELLDALGAFAWARRGGVALQVVVAVGVNQVVLVPFLLCQEATQRVAASARIA